MVTPLGTNLLPITLPTTINPTTTLTPFPSPLTTLTPITGLTSSTTSLGAISGVLQSLFQSLQGALNSIGGLVQQISGLGLGGAPFTSLPVTTLSGLTLPATTLSGLTLPADTFQAQNDLQNFKNALTQGGVDPQTFMAQVGQGISSTPTSATIAASFQNVITRLPATLQSTVTPLFNQAFNDNPNYVSHQLTIARDTQSFQASLTQAGIDPSTFMEQIQSTVAANPTSTGMIAAVQSATANVSNQSNILSSVQTLTADGGPAFLIADRTNADVQNMLSTLMQAGASRAAFLQQWATGTNGAFNLSGVATGLQSALATLPSSTQSTILPMIQNIINDDPSYLPRALQQVNTQVLLGAPVQLLKA